MTVTIADLDAAPIGTVFRESNTPHWHWVKRDHPEHGVEWKWQQSHNPDGRGEQPRQLAPSLLGYLEYPEITEEDVVVRVISETKILEVLEELGELYSEFGDAVLAKLKIEKPKKVRKEYVFTVTLSEEILKASGYGLGITTDEFRELMTDSTGGYRDARFIVPDSAITLEVKEVEL